MISLRERLFDLAVLMLLAPLIGLGIVIGSLLILLVDGGPVFFGSERMKTPDQSFTLWKFRTMAFDHDDRGVTGADKAHRVTATGRFLRRTRLDELPQAWNVLRGDIRFVGPRPPLRDYVERFPKTYAQVLKSRPGITGLATLRFKDAEARLLSTCTTAEETDRVYARRCIPRKARLDLIYQQHRSLCFDLALIGETALGLMPRKRRGPKASGHK